MTGNFIPIVLHQIVPDSTGSQFEDVDVSMLRRILETCRGRCVTTESWGAANDLSAQRFLLTFDDGNASDFEIVFPMLMQTDCNATFFIVTNKIGTRGFLSWQQVRDLHKAGMAMGSHSVSHPDMRSLPLSRQREELRSSRLCIEDRLGCSVSSFSFPFGKFNKSLVSLAWDTGYHVVCTSEHGVTQFPMPLLPRNSINGAMPWKSVLQTIEAAPMTRFKWKVEDMVKNSVRRVMGDNGYRALRSNLVKRRP